MPSNSNTDETTLRDLYDEFGIDRKYDHPSNISEENSHYERGSYPPDWSDRRKAVLEHQNGRCARCRTALKREDYYHCHHYRPVSEGGQHSLSNLVNLCVDCHKLIHPDVENIDGDWRQAAMFPHPDADPRMATVRQPVTDEEKQRFQPELSLIAEKSPVGENEFANSNATVPVSPADALRMREDFQGLLEDVGLAERTELTVRAVNSEHSPLRDASVAVEFPASGTVLNGKTDKYGEATFEVPSGIEVEGRVSKEEFENAEFGLKIGGGEEYREITLESSGPTGAGAASSAASASAEESGGESRRPVLKTLGLLGTGGVAGYLLSGSRGGNDGTRSRSAPANDASSGDANTPAGTETDSQIETSEPAVGFEEVWSNRTETFEAVSHVDSDDKSVYTATDSGLVRRLGSKGETQWTQGMGSPLHDIELLEDGLAVLTVNSLSLLVPNTGEEIWSKDVSSSDLEMVGGGEGAVVAGEQYYSGSYDSDPGQIVAYDGESGDQLWREDSISSGPEFFDLYNGELYYLDSGLTRVSEISSSGDRSPESVVSASSVRPAFSKENPIGYAIYYGTPLNYSNYLNLAAFDINRGAGVWEEELSNPSTPILVSASNNIIVVTGSGVYARYESGSELWSHSSEQEIHDAEVDWNRNEMFYATRGDEVKIVGRGTEGGDKIHTYTLDGEFKLMNTFDNGLIITTGDGTTRYLLPN